MKKTILKLMFFYILAQTALASPLDPVVKTPDQAVIMVREHIAADRVYSGWTTLACLDFVAGQMDDQYVPVTIFEIHNANCPGDPHTSPRVDSFRVHRHLGDIQWQNPHTLEWLSYVRFLDFRKAP